MAIADETGDGTTGPAAAERVGVPVDPYRLRRAFMGGLRLLIAAGVIGVLVGALWAKLGMSSAYQTTAVLKYEGAMRVADMPIGQDAIAPVADALKRQSVLRKIAEEIDFDGTLTTLEYAIGYDIDMMAGTIHVRVGGETGQEAADFARIVTDVFMDYHREQQAKRIEVEYQRVLKRIEAGEREVEVARRRYNEFREIHGIADLSTEQRSMVQSAAKLRADADLTVSEIRALEAQVASLEALLASTPKTSSIGGGVSPERAAYDRIRQELASASASLSDDHPRVQSLKQQVAQLGAALRQGGGSSVGGGLVGMNVTYQAVDGQLRDTKARLAALRERQKGLSEMADKAQNRVETFSDIEGDASALLAEIKVDENLLSGLRRSEAALEDALRDPPSGFVVLDPGSVPEYPERNKMKTIVFLAVPMVTVGLALLFILRREFGGFRLQTPAEFGFWGKGPVLGATTWPADPLGLDELVAGLDDFAPRARGSLLLIGGTAKESVLANELAERMNNDWFLTGQNDAPAGAEGQPQPGTPLQTPQPSGPYPLARTGAQSVALARRTSPKVQPIRLASANERLRLEAWDGPFEGQALRRAARLADQIMVLVPCGGMSVLALSGIQNRIGRERGIGYIVVGLSEELRTLPDRAGDVNAFWQA